MPFDSLLTLENQPSVLALINQYEILAQKLAKEMAFDQKMGLLGSNISLEVDRLAFDTIMDEPVYGDEPGKQQFIVAGRAKKVLSLSALKKKIVPVMEPNVAFLQWLQWAAETTRTQVKLTLSHERGDFVYDAYTWLFNYHPEATIRQQLYVH